MKHILITIAAVLLVGCGESQQSAPAPDSEPVEPVAEVPAQQSAREPEAKPVEPVAEAATPEPPTVKAPDIPIHIAARDGNIEAVIQHLADGADVDAKDEDGRTPLFIVVGEGHKGVAELLIARGADVNAIVDRLETPLDNAIKFSRTETADLLRKKGGKTGKEMGYK